MKDLTILIPNFRKSTSIVPTDTTNGPKSFPIELTYLDYSGVNYEIIDAFLYDLNDQDVAELLYSNQSKAILIPTAPSYLFWRCPPLNLRFIGILVESLKEMKIDSKVILYGPHGPIDSEYVLKSTKGDQLLLGEFDGMSVKDILTTDGRIVKLGIKKRLSKSNFTNFNFAAYEPHMWNNKREIVEESNSNYFLIEASRGCRFSCPFCFLQSFREDIRIKDLDLLVQELDEVKTQKGGYVFFIDETFGYPWNHYKEVCDIIKRFGIKYGIQTRPDIWNEDRINLLLETGCVYVELGLEVLEEELIMKSQKFKDDKLYEKVEYFNNIIPIVNKNIIDVVNPDYAEPDKSGYQRDNEGNAPPPLIPYPTTKWGDTSLKKYHHKIGHLPIWDQVDIIFAYYSYQANYPVTLGNRNNMGILDEIIELAKEQYTHSHMSRYDVLNENFKT